MSNRRRPKRPELSLHQLHLVDDVHVALQNLDAYRCPDCDSDLGEPIHHGDQVVSVQIRHDPTCPWLARAWSA